MMLLTLALLLPAQASANDAFNSVAFRETLRPRTASRCKAQPTNEASAAAANKCAKEKRRRG
jgi:hypothetical protein